MHFSQLSLFVALALSLSVTAAPTVVHTRSSQADPDFLALNARAYKGIGHVHHDAGRVFDARDSLSSDCVGSHCTTIEPRDVQTTATRLVSTPEATVTQARADNIRRQLPDDCAGSHCTTNVPRAVVSPEATACAGMHCTTIATAPRMLATPIAREDYGVDDMRRLLQACAGPHCSSGAPVRRAIATSKTTGAANTAHASPAPTPADTSRAH
ncbi:unnamed protein product [Peniophora sp. CBMAI 1063]|nr:unnamed protein product [Peniophora sp. CBMAI 1063]